MQGFGTNKRVTRRDVLQIFQEAEVLRPKDLADRGISRKHLQRLHDAGFLQRSSRGVYYLADGEITARHTLLEVAKRVPSGVICLLSALQFHQLTTQNPFEVWIALSSRAWNPQMEYPPLHIVKMSGAALTEGIEEHQHSSDVLLRVYSPAKTVADCFKYRNKIGLDVALEALRDGWRSKKVTMDELWRYAKIDRVTNVIRPYLESLS